MRFGAFLSYSHDDAMWARWLLRRLETYRVPSRLVGTRGAHGVIERRLGTVFRDREELPTAGNLGSTIRAALADSAALIVICSPAATRSRWVDAEIAAFHAAGRGDRVFCFVVAGVPGSGDPALDCFPPSLLLPDADGQPREPLAADARREGDGRERAFLKLVAGLLGVGYDALARREAQRRQRKLAIVAAASIAGMAIALALAATAYIARNDAQRRQAQAEDILGFMLGDLRGKLTTVGRLDLMRAVDDKATGYFATLDPRDMTDRALEEQARSLTGIGQVRLDEGHHDVAMRAFREAHARSTALHERAPGNGQRLFDLAQAEYWIGFVALQQGRLDDAQVWLQKYRDSAIKLAVLDRNNFDWQQEVAYGHYNLAVLNESRGRYAEAEQAMLQALALRQAWSKQRPSDTAVRWSLANTVSWLGTLSAQQGKLAEAEQYSLAQVSAISRNAADEPLHAQWQEEKADALILLAKAQAHRGHLAAARSSIARALSVATGLVRKDPTNIDWQATPGICRWWQARLAAASHAPDANALAQQAASIFVHVLAAEPKNNRVLRWLVKTYQLQAELALNRDDATTAGAKLAAAGKLLASEKRNESDESLRQLDVQQLMLAGEAAQAGGDAVAAQVLWQKAEQLLLADSRDPPLFDRLEPLVRTLHHRGQNERARRYQERLAGAGYVPLRTWPAPNPTTAQSVVTTR